MNSAFELSLKDKEIIKSVYLFAKAGRIRLYLVGGFIRDLLLGIRKEAPDFDFCLKKGAINFGRKLAQKIQAGFVVLDKGRGACRLVKCFHAAKRSAEPQGGSKALPFKAETQGFTLDFTNFRGPTLEKDLLRRDFTINALALDLSLALKLGTCAPGELLIDPCQGQEDLKAKRIKVVDKKAFIDDPLRILRAFSLAALLGFQIEKETLRLAKLERKRLMQVSPERIRDELFKIFDSGCAFDYLQALDRLKILSIIFPEIEKMRRIGQGLYHHLDILSHSLESIRQLELLMEEFKNNQDIRGFLNEVISGQRSRKGLLKFAAFLHDIGKPASLRRENGKITFHGHERIGQETIGAIAKRLKLSGGEINLLRKVVFWHLRPGYLADNQEPSPRAKFRYFRDTQEESISILLLSVADQRSTKGPLATGALRCHHEKIAFSLIKEYFRKKKEKKLQRLVNGDELMREFKLEPSPFVGRILSQIQELQAIGEIKSKPEAFKVAQAMIKKEKALSK